MIPPNDWQMKKCLNLILAIIMTMPGLIGLEAINLHIPILREIVGFIFLTFIPGILFLRILKIHNIGLVETLLYSVALSIAFIYATGLFANFFLPVIGIYKPISIIPLTIISSIFIFILCIIAYLRDKNFSPSTTKLQFSAEELIFCLLLLLVPILAILGAQFVNVYENNTILLVLLGLIASIVGLVSFNILTEKLYPVVIFFISISLLLHISLVSPSIYGSDSSIEYYLQNLVLENGYWDFSIPKNFNTCLSVVLLCPIYSQIMSIDSVWVFKIIYPLLYSLTPLALFQAYKKQIGPERSFMAVFYFLSIPLVILILISHNRQMIAEIFFALIILLIIDNELDILKKISLSLIFSISLAFSHYALAYISIIIFGLGYLLILVIKHPFLWEKISYLSSSKNVSSGIGLMKTSSRSVLNMSFILVLVIITLAWHMHISESSMFKNIIRIGIGIYEGLSEFFEPGLRENVVVSGVGVGFFQMPILFKAYRVFQYLTQVLIFIGFLIMLFRSHRFRFRIEFVAFILIAILVLSACIVLPRFGAYLGSDRFYHITSFILSPLIIIGGEAIWQGCLRLFSLGLRAESLNRIILSMQKLNYISLLTFLIIIPYFLFTSGFVFAFTNLSSSMALGPYKKDYFALHNQLEINASRWLWVNVPIDAKVYADATGSFLLYQRHYGNTHTIPATGKVQDNAYIFLRTWNIKYNEILVPAFQGLTHTYVEVNLVNRPSFTERVNNSNAIYVNGGAKLLAKMDNDG